MQVMPVTEKSVVDKSENVLTESSFASRSANFQTSSGIFGYQHARALLSQEIQNLK